MAENVLKTPKNEHDAHVFDKFVRIVSYMGMDALQKGSGNVDINGN